MTRIGLRIQFEAQTEIEDAFEYYRDQSPSIADRFLHEIDTSLKKILADPDLYPRYTKNTRRRVLGSFPYSVIYQRKHNVILIVAIAHAKRREGYWTKRVQQ